jgi:hypothetical protein
MRGGAHTAEGGAAEEGHALMTLSVERGALWVNDLARLSKPDPDCEGYVPVEVRGGWLVSELARAMEVPEAEVRGRLARGCRAWVAMAWAEAEVASWVWVSMVEEYAWPLRQVLHFGPDECHGWDVGTLERHRGHGLAAGLLRCAGWQMGRAGARRMWNGILDENVPSQLAHAAAGMRPVLRLVAVHDPEPTRLLHWAADYADPRQVERARAILSA